MADQTGYTPDMPIVSVVIPAYNPSEIFFREAVESVLAQYFGAWELLLVDDGSSESAARLFTDLVSLDPERIRYLHHPDRANRGISATRNLGIREARGTYVAFLDADDVWLPNKLEEQIGIMREHRDVAMVYGNSLYWSSWTGEPGDRDLDFIPSLGVRPDSVAPPPSLVPLHVRGRAAVPCPCSIMLRRDAALAVGGFEEAFRGMYEDQVFYAKLCLEAPVFVSSACWDRYRQHPEQMCSEASVTGELYLSRLRFVDWLVDYLTEKRCGEREVWEAVERERWLFHHYRNVDPHTSPGRVRNVVRWMKKWALRAEEDVAPQAVSRRIWARQVR